MIRSTVRRLTGGRWPRVRPGEMLPCPEVRRLMQRFLDGEIDDAIEVQAVVDHLDVCEPCGFEHDVYRRITAALHAHRPPLDETAVERLRAFGRGLVDG